MIQHPQQRPSGREAPSLSSSVPRSSWLLVMVGRDKDEGLQLPSTTVEAHISGTIKEGLDSRSQALFPNKYLSGSTMLLPEMPGAPADQSTATSVKNQWLPGAVNNLRRNGWDSLNLWTGVYISSNNSQVTF